MSMARAPHGPQRPPILLVLLSAAACSGGDGTTSPPPPTSPAVTTVEVTPATVSVVEGDSVALTATVRDQRGATMAGKAVSWTSSATSVATVSVAGMVTALGPGTATVTATADGRSGSSTVSVVAAVPQPPLRLVVEPSALLLPGAGTAAPLQALIVDARGRRFPTPATFTPNRAGVVTVGAGGSGPTTITAVARGSVQLTASAQGLAAPAVQVLVATPAPTVTLVPDSVVVGAITPLTRTGPVQTGWRYVARLRGPAPRVGARLVASGGATIAGQVVSVVQDGAVQAVTLEVRPVGELLPDLTVNERLPVTPAEAVLDPELRGSYRLETTATTIRVVPAAPGFGWPAAAPEPTASPWRPPLAADAATTFTLGPFKCKAEATVLPSFTLPFPEITFAPQLALDFVIDQGRLTRLALEGSVNASTTLKPRLLDKYSGKVTCTKPDIARIRLPLGGPLALLAGLHVPIGAGFDLSGSLSIAQFGVDLTLSARPAVQLGIACGAGGCEPLSETSGTPDLAARWVLPDLGTQFRVNVEVWPYAMVGLVVGSGPLDPWDLLGDLSLIKGRFGASQTADWAPMSVQAADTGYASSYRLRLKGDIAAGETLDSLVAWLRQDLGLPSFVKIPKKEVTQTLARSPSGRLTAAPAGVAPRDSVTYLVNLDTAAYLGSYGLDSLILQRRRGTPTGGLTLDTLAGPCNRIPVVAGQELFSCRAAFLDTGTVEVHAFVRPRVFGVSMPTWLEIAKDARAVTPVSDRLRTITGNVTVTSQAALQDLVDVGEITGSLSVSNVSSTDLRELSQLRRVGGDLGIVNVPSLTSLSGLANLQAAGTLVLANLAGITSLAPLRATFSGLQLGGMTNLVSLDMADFPPVVAGRVFLTGNPRLADLRALRTVTRIQGTLLLLGNAALANVTHLDALLQVDGDVTLGLPNGPGPFAFTGLARLGLIGGTLQLEGTSLTAFNALGELRIVLQSIRVFDRRLPRLPLLRFPALTTINGRLEISSSADACDATAVPKQLAFPALTRLLGVQQDLPATGSGGCPFGLDLSALQAVGPADTSQAQSLVLDGANLASLAVGPVTRVQAFGVTRPGTHLTSLTFEGVVAQGGISVSDQSGLQSVRWTNVRSDGIGGFRDLPAVTSLTLSGVQLRALTMGKLPRLTGVTASGSGLQTATFESPLGLSDGQLIALVKALGMPSGKTISIDCPGAACRQLTVP